MNGTSNYVRINVSLPRDLIRELKERVPARGVSKFISEAATEKIESMTQEEAFEKLIAGPPAFPHIKNPVKWVKDLRKGDLKRLKRLGI